MTTTSSLTEPKIAWHAICRRLAQSKRQVAGLGYFIVIRTAHNEPGPSEQHAAEYRQVASQMKDPQLKKRLEDMADVWDMLARERRQGVVENNPDQT